MVASMARIPYPEPASPQAPPSERRLYGFVLLTLSNLGGL